jgi:hypothetical protein
MNLRGHEGDSYGGPLIHPTGREGYRAEPGSRHATNGLS